MRAGKKSVSVITLIIALLFFVSGFISGFVGYVKYITPEDSDFFVSDDVKIYFLELGNCNTGDCIYIKAGNNDILIDAGSRKSSIPTLVDFLDEHVTDNTIEYVIVTHAHEDHYAGFATDEDTESIFDIYDCETIIDFSMVTKEKKDKAMYRNYLRELNDEINEGAIHYTAGECMERGKETFELGEGMEIQILDSYYYYNESDSENNHSVCFMLNHGDRHFLFTGDLEKEGEEKLTELNDLPEVDLYKAGHHGSSTSSTEEFLNVIQPKLVCVQCCCGSPEYTDNISSQFPTQAFIDRIAKYTDNVYVTTLCIDYVEGEYTSMNGNICVISDIEGVSVNCSYDSTLLKDTIWFSDNRRCPEEWK